MQSRLVGGLLLALGAAACSDPPTQEELASSGALASSQQQQQQQQQPMAGDGGACRLSALTLIPLQKSQAGQLCAQCLQARCCAQLDAADNTHDGMGMQLCMSACDATAQSMAEGQACYNTCGQVYPMGSQIVMTARGCVTSSCGQYCGGSQ